ncbi:PLD6 hydrolase, partial [Polypterus senegalus]
MFSKNLVIGSKWKLIGFVVAFATISLEGLFWLFRHHRPRRSKLVKEVLFFPTDVTCTNHLFQMTHNKRPCTCPLLHCDDSPYNRLLKHLLSARNTLDLCVFAFSNQDFARVVLELHRRNVLVRIFTDKDFMKITGSQIGNLRKSGIAVRHEQSDCFMHHKFAVVDKKLLITGSLNWTCKAIQCNKENILITEDAEIVQPFMAEFEKLWNESDPMKFFSLTC